MSQLTPEQIQFYKENADDTLQPNLISAIVCGTVLAISAVILRFITRHKSKVPYGVDDWIIALSLIPIVGYLICTSIMVSKGGGKHIIFVTDAPGFIKGYIAAMCCYSVAAALIKVSILCFYRRIFPSRLLLILSWYIGFFVVAYNTALVLVTVLECIPISALWTGDGQCIQSQLATRIGLASLNCVIDFVILFLPAPQVWNLQMKKAKKVSVLGIFLLGGIVCIFSIVRAVSIATAPQEDKSYTQAWPAIWSFSEISVGAVAACLPTLGAMIQKEKLRNFGPARWLFGSKLDSTTHSGGSTELIGQSSRTIYRSNYTETNDKDLRDSGEHTLLEKHPA